MQTSHWYETSSGWLTMLLRWGLRQLLLATSYMWILLGESSGIDFYIYVDVADLIELDLIVENLLALTTIRVWLLGIALSWIYK